MFEEDTFHASVFAESFRHAGELLWQYFNPRMRKGSSEDLVKRLEYS